MAPTALSMVFNVLYEPGLPESPVYFMNYSQLVTLAFTEFLNYGNLFPTSGPLYMLFLPMQTSVLAFFMPDSVSNTLQLRSLLLREACSDQPI